MPLQITKDEILTVGLMFASNDTSDKVQARICKERLKDFHSVYGAGPATFVRLIGDLQTTHNIEARIDTIEVKKVLLAARFLRTCENRAQLALLFKADKKWIWTYLGKIRLLMGSKVRILGRCCR